MRISVCLDPSRPWAQARAIAEHADAAGWYAVYQCDHFLPHDPHDRVVDGPVTECWTTLSALAPLTTRIRLGSLVLGNAFRHPAVVASMAATLDRVSDGRVVLGVGAGWQPNEHRAFGIPLLDTRDRLDAFDESCAILRTLLDDGRATFEGTTYHLDDARCDPRPVQQRLPILVGGAGERRTMRAAAAWGDVWHAWADPGTLTRKNAVLDERCAEVDRDPASLARATGGALRLGARDADREVSGTTAEVVDHLRAYAGAGADEFIVRDHASDPVGEVLDQIDALTRDVLPALTS